MGQGEGGCEGQRRGKTYSLLGQLACTLVFAVAEEFDDAAFVGGESVEDVIVSGLLSLALSLSRVTS